jgi:hypothetical protein
VIAVGWIAPAAPAGSARGRPACCPAVVLHHDRGAELARDVVLLTTVLSVPVLTGIAVALG